MAVKTTAKTPVRKPKKAISAPKAKRTAGSRLDKIDRAILSMTASIAASEAMLTEKMAASDEAIRQYQKETNRVLQVAMKDIYKNIGSMGEDIGEIVEILVLPGLKEKMNGEYRYNFNDVYSRKKFSAFLYH
ncbi:MAG: hypothetical protein LBB74_08210 [Chitinispirillales bacterium]|jgi:hypothetical protein|nr:hypothetical protein [Chitinispirillales bacterium]